MSRVLNSSGQAIIEAIMSGFALAFFTKLLLIALYAGFAHLWIDHQSYEYAICETQARNIPGRCEARFRRSIGNLLQVGELKKVRLHKTQSNVEVQVSFKVVKDLVVNRRKTLSLPLVR